jgi:hypothetical protein
MMPGSVFRAILVVVRITLSRLAGESVRFLITHDDTKRTRSAADPAAWRRALLGSYRQQPIPWALTINADVGQSSRTENLLLQGWDQATPRSVGLSSWPDGPSHG